MGDTSVWDGNGVSMNKLDTAAPAVSSIDRLYYRFLGDSFTVQVGPLTRNTEMMGYKASAYAKGGSKILDFFGGSLGTPGVWNKETGGGFGAIYTNKKQVEKGNPYFTVANYVADSGEANDSNPNTGGFMTDNSEGNITTQIAYGNNVGAAAGYRYGQCGAKFRTATETPLATSSAPLAPLVTLMSAATPIATAGLSMASGVRRSPVGCPRSVPASVSRTSTATAPGTTTPTSGPWPAGWRA